MALGGELFATGFPVSGIRLLIKIIFGFHASTFTFICYNRTNPAIFFKSSNGQQQILLLRLIARFANHHTIWRDSQLRANNCLICYYFPSKFSVKNIISFLTFPFPSKRIELFVRVALSNQISHCLLVFILPF